MDVGIRELKAHLSAYLERAARGEVIRVTDRGRAKAVLGPVPADARLVEGAAAGWIRAGDDAPPAKVKRQRAARRVADVLGEDRGR